MVPRILPRSAVYEPILATGFVAVLAAEVLKLTYAAPFFPVFMGLWLIQFAMIKLFDIDDFADNFTQYDVFAGKFRAYAYLFPFLQIVLGLAYLAAYNAQAVSIVLLIVATANLIGLYRQYDNAPLFGGKFLSAFLRTPLRESAIAENVLMLIMALAYLLTHKLVYGF